MANWYDGYMATYERLKKMDLPEWALNLVRGTRQRDLETIFSKYETREEVLEFISSLIFTPENGYDD